MSLVSRIKRLEGDRPPAFDRRGKYCYLAYVFDGLGCSAAVHGSEYIGRRQWRALRATLDPALLAYDPGSPPRPEMYVKLYGPSLPELGVDDFDPDEA